MENTNKTMACNEMDRENTNCNREQGKEHINENARFACTIDKNDELKLNLKTQDVSRIELFGAALSDANLTTCFNNLLKENNNSHGDSMKNDSHEKRKGSATGDAKWNESNKKPGTCSSPEKTSNTTLGITSDIRKVAGAGCDVWGLQRLKLAKIVRDYMRNNSNHVCSRKNKDQDNKTSTFILHDFCIENGTLLGAWRSGKFIPHDDDFDMAMFIDLLPTRVGGEEICSTEEGNNTPPLTNSIYKESSKSGLDSKSFDDGILPLTSQEADLTREFRMRSVLEQIKAYLDACFEEDGLTERYATRIVTSYCDKIEVFEPKYGDFALVNEFYGDDARFHYVTVDLQPYVRVGDHGVGEEKGCENLVVYHALYRAKHSICLVFKEDDVMPCTEISLEGELFPAPHEVKAVLTEVYRYLGNDAVYNKQTTKYEEGE